MKRFLVLSAFVLLSAQASSAVAQATTINISGKLSDGSFVDVVCQVGANGQITGTGVLYGVNNGFTYKYPFAVTSGTTAQGKLILTGKVVGGPPVTLSVSVPNGPMVFSYLVNGKTITLTGQDTVIVQ